VISSILLIAQAFLLRGHGASTSTMHAFLEDVAGGAPRGCCGQRRVQNLRGLALAALFFAVCEAILGLALGLTLGLTIIPSHSIFANSKDSGLFVCGSVDPTGAGPLTCLRTFSSANYTWFGPGYNSLSPLSLVETRDIGTSQYLMYAAGATTVSAVTNIVLATQTLHLCALARGLRD
jgi:hypothetical protein